MVRASHWTSLTTAQLTLVVIVFCAVLAVCGLAALRYHRKMTRPLDHGRVPEELGETRPAE